MINLKKVGSSESQLKEQIATLLVALKSAREENAAARRDCTRLHKIAEIASVQATLCVRGAFNKP